MQIDTKYALMLQRGKYSLVITINDKWKLINDLTTLMTSTFATFNNLKDVHGR